MNLLTGDSRFFYLENIKDFVTFPTAWDSSLNTGIGQSQLPALWIISYFNFTATFTKLGLTWDTVGLIFWILPGILLSFLSAFYLFNTLFPGKKPYASLAGFIYLFNTYFLMIFTGGQLGIALAYSVAPLVLARFIKIIQTSDLRLRTSVLAGLALALQVLFDPRIAYITIIAVIIYYYTSFAHAKTPPRWPKDSSDGGGITSYFTSEESRSLPRHHPRWLSGAKFVYHKNLKLNLFYTLLVSIAIAALIHSYWILSLLLTKSPPIPEGFSSIEGFEFLSFADFSHALSLLHPNWPENIFGKTYFLQPEFLLLPILAYSSLLFISKLKTQNSKLQLKSKILYFSLMGLLGAFLAKGANPPFGEINTWLFQYFPGMNMFRDPTKFYLLVALSYSVLIPFSVYSFTTWIISNLKFKIVNTHFKFKIYNVFLLFTICYLLFLVHPLWLGDLKNKFKPREVPVEYVQLKDFLVSQPEFFRTLWIPEWQRFGYFSNNHPAVGRYELLKSTTPPDQVEEINNEKTMELLQDLGVKYIIVPYDSEGEIFLDDRKYDSEKRARVEEELDKIPWLTKVRFNDLNHFSKLAVYETKGNKDRFWTIGEGQVVSWEMKKPTRYLVKINNSKPFTLVFSESFDSNWQAVIDRQKIVSKKTNNNLNSFDLTKIGSYTIAVEYLPQRYVYLGLFVSSITLLGSGYILLRSALRRGRQVKS